MKKNLVFLLGAGIFILGFSPEIRALNLGGMAKDTAKGSARGAVQKQYNERLAKQKCVFVGKSSSDYTGCNLDQIIAELNAFRKAAESSGLTGDVDIVVQTFGSDWDIARKRAEFLRDKVKSQFKGWDYEVKYNKGSSNEVLFQVAID